MVRKSWYMLQILMSFCWIPFFEQVKKISIKTRWYQQQKATRNLPSKQKTVHNPAEKNSKVIVENTVRGILEEKWYTFIVVYDNYIW